MCKSSRRVFNWKWLVQCNATEYRLKKTKGFLDIWGRCILILESCNVCQFQYVVFVLVLGFFHLFFSSYTISFIYSVKSPISVVYVKLCTLYNSCLASTMGVCNLKKEKRKNTKLFRFIIQIFANTIVRIVSVFISKQSVRRKGLCKGSVILKRKRHRFQMGSQGIQFNVHIELRQRLMKKIRICIRFRSVWMNL